MSEKSAVFTRFPLDRRIEHWLLVASFITLALTGLPQKFASHGWAEALIGFLGGIEIVRMIHRVAATVLMLEAVYHLGEVGYRVWVRRAGLSMLPTLLDVKNALGAFAYNLGLARVPPQQGRYTFEEKAEYWSLLWGTVVMILTGFMLWNPIATTRLLPGEFIPAAKAAHGGEALLAVLAILLWHLYGVHVRRFNKSMFTGQMNEEEMRHEHPLELADIKAGEAVRRVDSRSLVRRRRVFLPVYGVLAAALLTGIAFFVTFEKTAITTLPPAERVTVFSPQTPTPSPIPPPTETPAPTPSGAVAWETGIGPLFANRCSACHGAAALGGLILTDYASALKGGEAGAAIVPGDAAGSLLVERQTAGGHPGQLTPEELKLVTDWINAGAPEK